MGTDLGGGGGGGGYLCLEEGEREGGGEGGVLVSPPPQYQALHCCTHFFRLFLCVQLVSLFLMAPI